MKEKRGTQNKDITDIPQHSGEGRSKRSLKIQGQPALQSKFQVSQGYMKSHCLKQQNQWHIEARDRKEV